MYNNTVICGRLVNDLELRTSQQTTQKFCLFRVAVNEYNYYSKERTTQYINCLASGRTAENMTKFLKKGALILVEGSLKSRLINGENNTKINNLTVRATNVVFLESKKLSMRNNQQAEGIPLAAQQSAEQHPNPQPPLSSPQAEELQAEEVVGDGEIEWE